MYVCLHPSCPAACTAATGYDDRAAWSSPVHVQSRRSRMLCEEPVHDLLQLCKFFQVGVYLLSDGRSALRNGNYAACLSSIDYTIQQLKLFRSEKRTILVVSKIREPIICRSSSSSCNRSSSSISSSSMVPLSV